MARIEEKNRRLSEVPFFILQEYYTTTAAYYDPQFAISVPEAKYTDANRALDFVIYLPTANTFNTISLYAPSGATSGNIITDYDVPPLTQHKLDTSFTLQRYKGFWQTSAASAEWLADVYIKKGSRLFDWIVEHYPDYIQTDQDLLYFGKVVDHSDTYLTIKYQGHRDIPKEVIAKYNRKERFMVFLNAFFDRTQSLLTKKKQGLSLLRDIEEIEATHLNRIGRMLIDDIFDVDSEFYIPEVAKRLFLRELVNLFKKKGTYRPLYFLWDILSWFRNNTIQLRELYHSEPVEAYYRHFDKRFTDTSGAIVRGNVALDTMAGYDEVMLQDGVEMSTKSRYTDIPLLIMNSPAEVGLSAVTPVTVLDDAWIIDSRLPGLIATDIVQKVPFYLVNISIDEGMMWGLPPAYENICYNPSFEIPGSGAVSATGWEGEYSLVYDRTVGGDIAILITAGTDSEENIISGRQLDVADEISPHKDFYPELEIDSYLPDGIVLGGYVTSGTGYSYSEGSDPTIAYAADIVFLDETTTSITGSTVPVSGLSANKWNSVHDVFRFPGKRIKFISPRIVFRHIEGGIYADVVYLKPWYTSGAIINDIIANGLYSSFEKFRPTNYKAYYFLTKGLSADVKWIKHRETDIKEIWSIGQTSAGPSADLPAGISATSAVSAVKIAMYDNTYLPIFYAVLGQNGNMTITGDEPLSEIPSGTTYLEYGPPSGISAAASRVITMPVFEKKYYLSSGGDIQRVLIKIKFDSEDEVWFNELWLFDHDFKKLFFYSTFPKVYKPKNISVLFNIVLVPSL
jgi:hypothetical protein